MSLFNKKFSSRTYTSNGKREVARRLSQIKNLRLKPTYSYHKKKGLNYPILSQHELPM